MIRPTGLFYLLAVGLVAHWISGHVNVQLFGIAHVFAGIVK